MENIEQKLWDYIDGNTNEVETAEINAIIENNIEIKKLYLQYVHFNNTLSENLEIDEPSMGFVHAVMNKIELNAQPLSAKTRVNKNLILAIISLFIISLISVFIFSKSFQQLDYVEKSNISFDVSYFNFRAINNNYIYLFLLIDIMAIMLLIDKYLRYKLIIKSN